MKMITWIEGITLLATGFIGVGEGLRLAKKIDPDAITDVLGPGYYIFFLGLILIIIGVTYLSVNYKNIFYKEKKSLYRQIKEKKAISTVFYMILVLIIYFISIYIAGYLVPTLIFFFLEFRVAGLKSWKRNILLTLVVTAVFYLIFIKYCRMVFPHGLFFK
jgi:branched-subunit amino acid transport protein AzlD